LASFLGLLRADIPPMPPPSVFVATSGSDSNSCSRKAPCASFSRAYSVAAPGKRVEVAGGAYGPQTIDASAKAGVNDVVFAPATGASVVLDGLEVARGSHLEFRDLTVKTATYNRSDAQYVTYRRIKMRQFFIRGADHIRYFDSEVGPNVADDGMNWITAAYQTDDAAHDVLLSGLRIHDFKKWNAGAHVDCIGIDDVDGLTIRQTRIWNCEHYALIFGTDVSSHRGARHVLVENSFLDCCFSGYYTIGLGYVEGPMTIRFNSLTRGLGWLGSPTQDVTIDSNVIANNNEANCSKAVWRYNVVGVGSACTRRLAPTKFRSPPDDLHIVSRSAAVGAGNPKRFPSTDVDGQPRPLGSRPDAGADELR
jgi:hypothetical protein